MNRLTPRDADGAQPAAVVITAALARLQGQSAGTFGRLTQPRPASAPAPSPVYRYAINSPYFTATYYDMAG